MLPEIFHFFFWDFQEKEHFFYCTTRTEIRGAVPSVFLYFLLLLFILGFTFLIPSPSRFYRVVT